MEQVRVGVVGVGNMGTPHAKRLFEGEIKGAVLSAVCDIRQDRLDRAKGLFGTDTVKYYLNAEELFASGEIDAAIIATPHYDHPPLAISALGHNLNVLVEKPAGVYTKQVKEMMECAKKSDKVFGIMFNQRTNPLYQKARELVQDGTLGELRRVNWIITDWYRTQSYYDSGDWRATWSGEGGGVLMNQCPHQLDLIQWICGVPKSVRAFCEIGKYHNIEVEDDVTAYLKYENGATGVFITTTGDAPGTNRLEITGANGKIVIENDKLTFYQLRTPVDQHLKEAEGAWDVPECWTCEVPIKGENSQHRGILQNWTDAILKGTPLLADGQEGINGITLANAMYLSSWTDSTVEIPFDDDQYLELLEQKKKNSKFKKIVHEKLAEVGEQPYLKK